MTVEISTPATIFDLAELSGAMTRTHWLVAKQAWRTGPTYAFRAGAELVALAGLWPMILPGGEQVTELWFCPAPAASAHMTSLVLRAKLTLAQVPYRGIYTIPRSEPGQRIARLLGFSPFGSSELGEIWRHGRHADRQGGQGRAEGTGGRPGIEPAPVAGPDGIRAG